MITVYVWNYRGKNVAWGHASMLVNKTYVSWWPQGQDREKIVGDIYSVRPIPNRTYADDKQDEGQGADHQIVIKGLAEPKIIKWWNHLKSNPASRWTTLGQNCSTTVANALCHGGADEVVDGSNWWHTWNIVWKPDDLLRYARAIAAGLKK